MLLQPLYYFIFLYFYFYFPYIYPEQAASTIAIQNASVKLVFKKIFPWINTFLTWWCFIDPNNITRSCNKCFSRICSNSILLGPSPPFLTSNNHIKKTLICIFFLISFSLYYDYLYIYFYLPIINRTFLCISHILGITATSKSIPFR